MEAKTKSRIVNVCAFFFVIISVISITISLRIFFLNKQDPLAVLFGKELEVKNKKIEIRKNDNQNSSTNFEIKLDNGKEISYIFVRLTDQKGENFTYKLYTPGGEFFPKDEFFKNHVVGDSSFNIISEAHADHKCHISKVECSGTYYDSQGNYHADGCWCRK